MEQQQQKYELCDSCRVSYSCARLGEALFLLRKMLPQIKELAPEQVDCYAKLLEDIGQLGWDYPHGMVPCKTESKDTDHFIKRSVALMREWRQVLAESA